MIKQKPLETPKQSKSTIGKLPDYSELHDKFKSHPFFTIPQLSNIALNFPNITKGKIPYRAD